MTYTGDDLHTVLRLVAAGHGLTLLPAGAASPVAVPLVAPRVVHRIELLHGTLAGHAERVAENLRR
jgi:DNA-binding transcriptional LysR family regulator